jgi:CheY-like chemotaxis protein
VRAIDEHLVDSQVGTWHCAQCWRRQRCDSSIQDQIEQQGCTVDAVDSFDKAMTLFKPGSYHLISMDLELGKDSSGQVITKNFRSLEKGTNQHVPIVALTGFPYSAQLAYDFDYYQIDGCLVKPVSEEQIGQLLKYFVSHENINVEGLYLNPKLITP